MIHAVLFDFDGTIADTAPDLAGTANDMRVARGLAPLPIEALRPMVSAGARGMIGLAFGLDKDAHGFEPLKTEFLDRYEHRMTQASVLFSGVTELLVDLEQRSIAWGVVTNKAQRFAKPLVPAMGLRPRVLICGDTTAHAKPHPEPLLEAARRLGVLPSACAYVGDDLRDVQAARAAGMRSIIANYGYLGDAGSPETWGADAMAQTVPDILGILDGWMTR
ncbi:phosphoglycolate phosphatase [beta proteobacterium AAP99]|nr:phosphoglycolate phosphatase [beta proteobacterium AAP99]